jgi:hypothetical protein
MSRCPNVCEVDANAMANSPSSATVAAMSLSVTRISSVGCICLAVGCSVGDLHVPESSEAELAVSAASLVGRWELVDSGGPADHLEFGADGRLRAVVIKDNSAIPLTGRYVATATQLTLAGNSAVGTNVYGKYQTSVSGDGLTLRKIGTSETFLFKRGSVCPAGTRRIRGSARNFYLDKVVSQWANAQTLDIAQYAIVSSSAPQRRYALRVDEGGFLSSVDCVPESPYRFEATPTDVVPYTWHDRVESQISLDAFFETPAHTEEHKSFDVDVDGLLPLKTESILHFDWRAGASEIYGWENAALVGKTHAKVTVGAGPFDVIMYDPALQSARLVLTQMEPMTVPGASVARRAARTATQSVDPAHLVSVKMQMREARPVVRELTWDTTAFAAALEADAGRLGASQWHGGGYTSELFAIEFGDYDATAAVHPGRVSMTIRYDDDAPPSVPRRLYLNASSVTERFIGDYHDHGVWYGAARRMPQGTALEPRPVLSTPRNVRIDGRPAKENPNFDAPTWTIEWDAPQLGTPSYYLVTTGAGTHELHGRRLTIPNPTLGHHGEFANSYVNVRAVQCARETANPCGITEMVEQTYGYDMPAK